MKTRAAVAWEAGKPLEIEMIDLDGEPRIAQCRLDVGADETDFYADCNGNGIQDDAATPGCDHGAGILGVISIFFGLILIGNYANLATVVTFIWVVAGFAIVGGIVQIVQAFGQRNP